MFKHEVTGGTVVSLRRAGAAAAAGAGAGASAAASPADPASSPLYAVVACYPGGRRALTVDLSPVGPCSLKELLPSEDWDTLRKAAYAQTRRLDFPGRPGDADGRRNRRAGLPWPSASRP